MSIIVATKRGIRTERMMNPNNLKIRITTTQTPLVHTLGKLQHLMIQMLLAMDLTLVHKYLKLSNLILGQYDLFIIYWPQMPLIIPSGTVPMYVMSLLIP